MRLILVGFGSVGRAVAAALKHHADSLYADHGLMPRLVGVIDSRGAAVCHNGLDVEALLAAKKACGTVGACGTDLRAGDDRHEMGQLMFGPQVSGTDIIRDTQAEVLVEASPSVLSDPGPAIERIKAALSSGKHVISANKAPLATAMPALLELAAFNRVQLRYSGTVGAGTPVLATARTLSAGDRITRVRAILNGTTNFILHRMAAAGESYAAALAEAVRLGYAETDPSADVDGIDTATKVVILANSLLEARDGVTIRDVRIAGIRDIPKERIEAAKGRACVVKLIGELVLEGSKPALSVSPQEVPAADPMNVPANLNAVCFSLATSGDLTLVGRGAGGPETATAVLRDLVDIWHSAEEEAAHRGHCEESEGTEKGRREPRE